MLRQFFLVLCVVALTGVTNAQTSRASVPASEVNGTFSHGFTAKYKGSSSEIKILALGRGRLRIAMELLYPYTMQNGDLMANTGTLDGEATIVGDTAVYKSSEFGACKITVKFVKLGAITVTQE